MSKVALITAGGSGVGADSARTHAADSFNVGILSSSVKGKTLAKEAEGCRAWSVQSDKTYSCLVRFSRLIKATIVKATPSGTDFARDQREQSAISNSQSDTDQNKTYPRLITQPFACLLYTSPSPRDKRQSRMPSSA